MPNMKASFLYCDVCRPPVDYIDCFTWKLVDIANDITTVHNVDLFILEDFNICYLEKYGF